jgi:TrmH family RNA methyltransferase
MNPPPTADLTPDRLRIVLVETQGEANLGSVARTLSCFGVHDWWLVRPRRKPGQQSRDWACHAKEWLENVRYCDTLLEALEGVNVAVALTGKSGKRRHRMVTPSQLTSEVLPNCQLGRVALVFGNEESGLDNADIELCHWRVKVPTDEVHFSLNLAHTVTLMVYELLGRQAVTELGGKPVRAAGPEFLHRALDEFSQFLAERGYPSHAARLEEEMRKVSTILHRSQLEVWEVNFLLGMLRHLRNHERGYIKSKAD